MPASNNKKFTNMPPAIINAYIKDVVVPDEISMEFVPTMPTDIDAFTEQFPGGPLGALGVYDRMFRMRRIPMPHIKCEQLLYYFYARDIQELYRIQEVFLEHFDRGDESGQDINAWYLANRNKIDSDTGKPIIAPHYQTDIFFHSFKIYQLNESRDIIDFGTARTWAGNKIIIEYDYHSQTPSEA